MIKVVFRFLLLLPVFAFLVSCGPVISKEVMSSVDQAITFQDLIKNPDQYKGKTVVLGGKIISTLVKQNETWMEVLQQPLGSRQRPEDADVSYGRFLVKFTDYRDPAVYSQGRAITVAGQVLGKEVRPLSQIEYTYPVLLSKEAYLWKLEPYPSEPRFHFGVGVGVFR